MHGVSGTPPEHTLNYPHPQLVAGDSTTGFYRRWWPGGQPTGEQVDVPETRRREAYAWGGLTSGGKTIALWLLLLPFSLANLAYFMLPRPARGRRLRHAVEAALRLFALLLTGTLVSALTVSAVDLVGWQCTGPGRPCTGDAGPAWVRWIGQVWDTPSPRLAVTSLLPFTVVAVLWWTARRTWVRDEMTRMPEHHTPPPGLLLAQPRLWHGAAPVLRLRAVHIAFAVGSIGLAVSSPFVHTPRGLALTVANGVVQLIAAVLVALPAIARRLDPGHGRSATSVLDTVCVALRWTSVALFLVTFALALTGLPLGVPVAEAGYRLPSAGAAQAQFDLTIALTLFILIGTAVLAGMDRPDPGTRDPVERRAMGGMASWFVLMVAIGSANTLGLGLMFWTASYFGVPESMEPGPIEPIGAKLFLGDPVWWTAALLPVLVVGALLVAVLLVWLRGKAARAFQPPLGQYYGVANSADVARKWALASLTDRAGLALGLLTGVGLAAFATVTVIYQLHRMNPSDGAAAFLTSIGSWALATIIVGLVLLGRRSYGDSKLRRTVGIIWDISTFWPRAIHPLAPPCYTERVIPELVARVGALTRDENDKVILSGHSQGSVIAAALVLQLPPEVTAKVRLLTHGSPLRRLYAGFFPAYFGTSSLSEIRRTVPWSNLYRLSDPIGGPVFRRVDPFAPPGQPDPAGTGTGAGTTAGTGAAGTQPQVDRYCWDPPQPAAGEPLPRMLGHSGYWLCPPYDETLTYLTAAACGENGEPPGSEAAVPAGAAGVPAQPGGPADAHASTA
ncbi:hypothetical protein JOL79_04260 [Microbispora sp. RL4-1S]|uniref:Lipase family protein n=1 Tax=Microbispora oryzae TaxID=2806554 RepID=A0A941AGJ8_9ACTN|nr:hypothetical protein [Microbispora oryzae]MBP2703015.1 hypothetical protein [Microbispora oryzae]